MKLPKAEDYAFRFLGTADPKLIQYLASTMKEYARHVLGVIEERYYDADGSVTFRSIIDKIKDEL